MNCTWAYIAVVAALFFFMGGLGCFYICCFRKKGRFATRVQEANKQFTENAAHELQTPLAVIKGHVELLLQSPQMGEAEMEVLDIILKNTNRLAKINSSLILLSKIEHNRFADHEVVDIGAVVEEVLGYYVDLIEMQKLEVRKAFHSKVQYRMSPALAEILISNLLQNATRHNVHNGWIGIELEKNRLIISNPGDPLDGPPEALFGRFERQTEKEESLGLGLSIIKRICDYYGFTLGYEQEGTLHRLIVSFNSKD
ncbi:MAG: hypothetical protein IPL49_20245 [Saprospirales bacterium]|nr:hypothetical protein [Saprospirales bacterium]MBK8493145.1 hypothetical protein [Saprospirales bacterium]